jgi:hypothetical protein
MERAGVSGRTVTTFVVIISPAFIDPPRLLSSKRFRPIALTA